MDAPFFMSHVSSSYDNFQMGISMGSYESKSFCLQPINDLMVPESA